MNAINQFLKRDVKLVLLLFADVETESFSDKMWQFIEFIPNIFIVQDVYYLEGWG